MTDQQNPDIKWSDKELQEMDTDSSVDELEIKRNPISTYIERKHRQGKETKYVENISNILREYEAFLYDQFEEHVCDVDDSHIVAFNEFLKSENTFYVMTDHHGNPKTPELSDRGRHDYLQKISAFYSWLVDTEEILSKNPVQKALSDFPKSEFDLSPPGRPRIELGEMSDFLNWLSTPFERAFFLLLLKTAVRRGEAANIDLCCLNIDHPLYKQILEKHDIELVSQVDARPDSLYIYPKFQSGTEIQGTVRRLGNKRERPSGTVIPIDSELKTALLEYLLTRRPPETDPEKAHPLFVRETSYGDQSRITKSVMTTQLTGSKRRDGALSEYGWHEAGAPTEENVTLHYFRHYFTHNHRHGEGVHQGHMPEGVIGYIRGDAPEGESARETVYRHNDWNVWKTYIKEPYLNGIYQFGIYD